MGGSSLGELVRVFLEVLVHPNKVLSEQKKKSTIRKGLLVHILAALLPVLLGFHHLLSPKLSWLALLGLVFFIAISLVCILYQLLTVVIIHVVSKVLGGRGRFVEILWLTAVYAIQVSIIGIIILETIKFSGWFLLLYAPCVVYALFLDYKAIRVSHLLSRVKGIIATISSFIVGILLFVSFLFVVYLALIAVFVMGFFGLNYYYGTESTIIQSGDTITYYNTQEGYSFVVPDGWYTTRGNDLVFLERFVGQRYFMKNDSGMIMIYTGGFFQKMMSMEKKEFTPEKCGFLDSGSGAGQMRVTSYKDYGNAKGCETRSLGVGASSGQIMFNGICCGKSTLMINLMISNTTSQAMNQTTSDYEKMMGSIICRG